MDAITSLFRDSVEFANPEYLAIVPIAGLLLAFGLVVFALRLQLRPARTEGSNYPLFGHIKFWFFAIAALTLVAVAAASAPCTRSAPISNGRPRRLGATTIASARH